MSRRPRYEIEGVFHCKHCGACCTYQIGNVIDPSAEQQKVVRERGGEFRAVSLSHDPARRCPMYERQEGGDFLRDHGQTGLPMAPPAWVLELEFPPALLVVPREALGLSGPGAVTFRAIEERERPAFRTVHRGTPKPPTPRKRRRKRRRNRGRG